MIVLVGWNNIAQNRKEIRRRLKTISHGHIIKCTKELLKVFSNCI